MTSTAPLRPLRGLAAAVAALSLAACGGGGSDAAPPALTATLSPASGALGTTQTIRVVFNAPMNGTSQVLGGTLSGANLLSGWTTTTATNDTLVLAPALPWATGAQTLTVTATDTTGRTLAAPLQASYTVAAASTCGPSAGACNNASDCGFTVAQLAESTQTCFIANNLDQPATVACVEQDGVSAGCATCTTAMAACGVASCFSPCAAGGGFSSAECIACVASSCGAGFLTCAGRTL